MRLRSLFTFALVLLAVAQGCACGVEGDCTLTGCPTGETCDLADKLCKPVLYDDGGTGEDGGTDGGNDGGNPLGDCDGGRLIPVGGDATVGSVGGGDADSCATAGALVFDNNRVRIQGDLTTATNNNTGGESQCSLYARSTGKDRVYSYTLTQSQDVRIEVTPQLNAFAPVVYVRKPGVCTSGLETDRLACNSSDTMTAPNVVMLYNQAPGTYSLWVDSSDKAGPFTLQVDLLPPTAPPSNDTCASATQVTSFPAVLQGSTAGAANDYQSTCYGALYGPGGDVVYTFTTASTQKLTAKVTPHPDSPTLLPLLYVRPLASCATNNATPTACGEGFARGEAGQLVVSALPAGSYALIVDGARPVSGAMGTNGPFTLELNLTTADPAPTNTSCGAATALVFDAQGIARVTGNSTGASDTTKASCSNTSTGADVVYKLTTPTLSAGQTSFNAKLRVTSLNGQELWPTLSVRNVCASSNPSNELDCETADPFDPLPVTLQLQGLTANTDYFVWVDSAIGGNTEGPFELVVQLAGAPASNESCANAAPLTVNTTVTGSTVGAADHINNTYYTGCDETMPGPDLLYSFTAPESRFYTVTVNPNAGFDVGLGVLKACSTNQCLASTDGAASGMPETITFSATQGQTYFIVVDANAGFGEPTDRGAFTLSITPAAEAVCAR